MALADYFSRNATAASQVLVGYDPELFRSRLNDVCVGVAFGDDVARSPEGRKLLDLLIRLLSRLYPCISVRSHGEGEFLRDELCALAQRINPALEILNRPIIEIFVGIDVPSGTCEKVVFCGCDNWKGILSSSERCSVGASNNSIGPAIGACLAAAAVFRCIFVVDSIVDSVQLSGFSREIENDVGPTIDGLDIGSNIALIGFGAIGNAALWALAHAPVKGELDIVDPQAIELSNIQRYVLTQRSDEGRLKVDLAETFANSLLRIIPHHESWAQFVSSGRYAWNTAIVALDSAADRIKVQCTLPKWIANAWTQLGDLGVSTHAFIGDGACLACLYTSRGSTPNKDQLVAESLRIPESTREVRDLLAQGLPAPRQMLEQIARNLGVDVGLLEPYQHRPLNDLYVEGICGGALLPHADAGITVDIHVPIAHQSALAGVLLAGATLRHFIEPHDMRTMVTRLDVMRSAGRFLTQPALKNSSVPCICADDDYLSAYRLKYREEAIQAEK